MGPQRVLQSTYLQALLLHSGWTGARLMIGYAAIQFTTDPFALALMAATFAAPAIAFALSTGVLIDKVGAAPVVTAGMVIACIACAVAANSNSFVLLLAANVALGFGQLLCMVGQQAFVAEAVSKREIDRSYGRLTSAMSIGQLIGPIVVSVAASIGITSGAEPATEQGMLLCACIIALAIPFGAALILLPTRRDQQVLKRRTLSVAADVIRTKGMWRAFVVSGVVLASVDLLYVFLPAWAAANGISALSVGWLLALRALLTVVSRLGLGRLTEWMGRKRLLAICQLVGAAAFVALPFVETLGAAIVMIALGFALGLPQPLTIAWVVTRAPASTRGAALGLRVTSNRLVQLALPMFVGAVAAPAGVTGMFIGSAAVLLSSTLVTMTAGTALNDDLR